MPPSTRGSASQFSRLWRRKLVRCAPALRPGLDLVERDAHARAFEPGEAACVFFKGLGRCWAHGRRKFFDLARLSKAPIATEAVKRIDVLFAIEREINGMTPQLRVRARYERSRPLIIELQTWLREQRARISKHSETGKAIDYSLKRWAAFTRFLDDGRLCMSNNAAERELRAVAMGRKIGPSPAPTKAAGAPPPSTR